MRRKKLYITLMVLLTVVLPIPAFSETSVNVNIDSWVYPALERLEAVGLIESGIMNTKPFTRMEAARLTGEALRLIEDRKPKHDSDDLTIYFLERLKKEFRGELSNLGITDGVQVSTFIKPIDELRVKYHWLDGNYSIYNNDGIRYGDHNNVSMEFSGYGNLFDAISLYYQPIFEYNQNLNDHAGTDFALEKGYAKLTLFNIECEVGRDSLWWGPGYNGDFLMTNNAKPFDTVKLSNPRPILLPWILRYLGPFKATLMLSKLDKDRPVAEKYQKPYLYGLRLNIKPLPILEIGISHIVIFGGKGVHLGFGETMEVLFSNRNLSGNKESNQELAIDFSLWVRDIGRIIKLSRAIKLYGEIGAEDTGTPPDKRAYLWGLLFNGLFLTGKTDLRIEYAKTSPASVPTAWYTHRCYPPTYKGRIFGHHVGTDAEDIFVRATSYLTNDLVAGIDVDMERHGLRSTGTEEKHYQFGVDLSYNVTDTIQVKGRYGFELVDDYCHEPGVSKNYHFLGGELSLKF